ncbi:MAG: hypothetical protein WBA37_14875 [Xanthobacteraceae bacterium]
MKRTHPQRGAQPCGQAISSIPPWRKGYCVGGQRRGGVQHDQRNVGLRCRYVCRECFESRISFSRDRGDHGRRLRSVKGLQCIGPIDLDNRIHPGRANAGDKRAMGNADDGKDRSVFRHIRAATTMISKTTKRS